VICQYHASGGTTALAPTTVVAPQTQILAVLEAVGKIDPNHTGGARILGIHLEGPYFSKEKPGAHLPELIRNPDPAEYEAWLPHRDRITQVTLAPELPGALELIDTLCKQGIRASGGHSDAWDEHASAAFAHGMRQVTHTYNCMSSARRRGAYRVAGLLEFAMGEPEVLCELIAGMESPWSPTPAEAPDSLRAKPSRSGISPGASTRASPSPPTLNASAAAWPA
jgi:N-acetylglucosamine-6-phosphate deacetylase